MFRPNFSAKMKNVVQPTRIFCTSRISWNRISDWLPIIFHFGTENWEEQLKKAPCSLFLPELAKKLAGADGRGEMSVEGALAQLGDHIHPHIHCKQMNLKIEKKLTKHQMHV